MLKKKNSFCSSFCHFFYGATRKEETFIGLQILRIFDFTSIEFLPTLLVVPCPPPPHSYMYVECIQAGYTYTLTVYTPIDFF